MKIEQILTPETVQKLRVFRTRMPDHEQIMRPDVEIQYHEQAISVLKTFPKDFARLVISSYGFINRIKCNHRTYKFAVKPTGTMIVYDNKRSRVLSQFIVTEYQTYQKQLKSKKK